MKKARRRSFATVCDGGAVQPTPQSALLFPFPGFLYSLSCLIPPSHCPLSPSLLSSISPSALHILSYPLDPFPLSPNIFGPFATPRSPAHCSSCLLLLFNPLISPACSPDPNRDHRRRANESRNWECRLPSAVGGNSISKKSMGDVRLK